MLCVFEPPSNAVCSAVSGRDDVVEESPRRIDRVAYAAHTFVHHFSDMDRSVRALYRHKFAAVRVVVRLIAHQLVWQSDCHVAVSVDYVSTSAETWIKLVRGPDKFQN